MKNLIVLILWVTTLNCNTYGKEILNLSIQANSEPPIEALKAFAKLYGYVQYFHPSDEAAELDWNKFAAYGAQQVLELEANPNPNQVMAVLKELFKPIAPSIQLSLNKPIPSFDLTILQPNNCKKCKPIYWQHRGFFEKRVVPTYYKKIRVHRDAKKKLFDQVPTFGEITTKNIGLNITCQVPLVLYGNKRQTYPQAEVTINQQLHTALTKITDQPSELSVRLGNVIKTYVVFQHFYPYFEEVEVNWEQELTAALRKSFTDQTALDHLYTLQEFTATLEDGHIRVRSKQEMEVARHYVPPIYWEWIENKLVVTNLYADNLGITVGDVVTHINKQAAKDFFAPINHRISAATKGWRDRLSETNSLLGLQNSTLTITIKDQDLILKRNWDAKAINKLEKEQQKTGKWLTSDTYYLHLPTLNQKKLKKLRPILQKSKAIICDLRAYPNNEQLISHLLTQDDTVRAWMQTPNRCYPDQAHIQSYTPHQWLQRAKKPYLGDKKIIFLTNGGAISFAESYMAYIKHYQLGTIVGQPTAGTNGDVAFTFLLGGYRITFTGKKVRKLDGSRLHGIGIIPDVLVHKTIKGVKEGRDEFLEKALEIIRE